ncbi:unnamed protein product, partial [Ectocarpus sp. 6 AP-2014]
MPHPPAPVQKASLTRNQPLSRAAIGGLQHGNISVRPATHTPAKPFVLALRGLPRISQPQQNDSGKNNDEPQRPGQKNKTKESTKTRRFTPVATRYNVTILGSTAWHKNAQAITDRHPKAKKNGRRRNDSPPRATAAAPVGRHARLIRRPTRPEPSPSPTPGEQPT